MGNKKNREILKSYFQLGSVPTESQFADLIDSVPNLAEDGLVRTEKDGLLLYAGTEGGRVASAYKYPEELQEKGGIPCWSLVVGDNKEFLLMNEKGETVCSLSQDKKVCVYDELEVKEQITARSYKGDKNAAVDDEECLELPADGYWHDLPIEFAMTRNAPKCRIFHIVASYKTDRNKYCMTEVTASYCKGGRLKIASRQKKWGCWMSPIRFRWDKREDGLFLQIRGKEKRHGAKKLHYQIRELWSYFDTIK